jgi:DNA-binding MarR family transcriptional regulator
MLRRRQVHAGGSRPQDPVPPRAENREDIRGILNALRHIVRDLRLGAREAERTAGISGAQLFVLQTLASGHVSSLNDLADRTMTDPSSVSVVVRRLVERKLVTRKVSKDDARRVELRLTAHGKKRLALSPEPMQARLLTSLRTMTPHELSALTEGLAALMREMGAQDAGPPMFFEDALPRGALRPAGARKASRRDE